MIQYVKNNCFFLEFHQEKEMTVINFREKNRLPFEQPILK
jgi:hypothetical protein